ncbi:MAG: glycosyl hydrolase [Bacteroidetes bacterium B1(2017)]|nr:MAG: glycosyl hydrolase [Bacteroidetes bacterium B1(2017)]
MNTIKHSLAFLKWLLPALLLWFEPKQLIAQTPNTFADTSLSQDARIANLLQTLSVEEKINLLTFQNEGVPRLKIASYNWWNEGLHGVARAGQATVFPQAIGMAASFNPSLLKNVADAISTEARAKYNLACAKHALQQYQGLSFWAPNINIYRDPRWGRAQETYGEDPYLTSQMGIAFVGGLQGNNPNQLKAAACAKHFAVHSGPENQRHSFNALLDEKDLRETYLYAFKKLVDAHVESVMCAYNRVNDQPCCTGNFLLTQVLRKEYMFKGQVLTDCWALEDIRSGHKTETDGAVIAAQAIKEGVNLECGSMLSADLLNAYKRNLITLEDLNAAIEPTLRTQLKLGLLNVHANPSYLSFGQDSIANAYHLKLARQMAQESIVLLSNNGVLPLQKDKVNALMLLGSIASSEDVLLGNYNGLSAHPVSFVSGITAAVGAGTRVEYNAGYSFTDTTHFGGLWAASNAKISIAFIGTTPDYEGEEGDAFLSNHGGDRTNNELPASQLAFLRAYKKANPTQKLIVVITGGACFNLTEIEAMADAILVAWYPGEQGGNALADVLFGTCSPSGKLPITYYQNIQNLPSFTNYDMQGRTYRYLDQNQKYPFGFGLSYANFSYQWKQKPKLNKTHIQFSVQVKNNSSKHAAEVVQAYISYPNGNRMPVKELKAFQKPSIAANDSVELNFSIPIEELKKWDLENNHWKLYPGKYTLTIGSHSQDQQLVFIVPIKENYLHE